MNKFYYKVQIIPSISNKIELQSETSVLTMFHFVIRKIRDEPLPFIGRGGGGGGGIIFFAKKLFGSCSWLKKLSASRLWGEKLSAKQKQIF